MKGKRSTIRQVVKHRLCTGCGTCAGVCPQAAVAMTIDRRKGCYVPRIDKSKCIQCGLCLDACPGPGVDFDGLSKTLMGKVHENVVLGKYLGCYVGHALDKDIRYDGASGGLVTALLIFALERGLIDGALVTQMQPSKPLETKAFIARTKEEIISAARSKYCPVAAGVALEKILNSEGRFAVVGLPCHIQGIRKAEQHIPRLKQRIRYHIGLTCSMGFSFRGTQAILHGLNIPAKSVETIEYRGRGWPGSMMIRQEDGTRTTVSRTDYYKQLGPFSLRRCTLCSDMFAELSDISCGDAWVPSVMKKDKEGSSFALTRTAIGEELLEMAAAEEGIRLSDLAVEDLSAAQNHAIFKKRRLKARMNLFRWTGKPVPHYQQKLLQPIRGDYKDTIKFFIARYVLTGNRPILRRLFQAARLLKRKNREKGTLA